VRVVEDGRRFGVGCGRIQEAAMSTVTIVVVGIWNGLLLAALAALVTRWKQVLQWITQSDGENQNEWERSGADGWVAFLAEHPELIDR
jgi:hypothetical protein